MDVLCTCLICIPALLGVYCLIPREYSVYEFLLVFSPSSSENHLLTQIQGSEHLSSNFEGIIMKT